MNLFYLFDVLPSEVILKIIDIPWRTGSGSSWSSAPPKQIRIEYKHKNPYNSLIKVSKGFNKSLSNVDILIPVVASYSARQFTKVQLLYIGRQLGISLNEIHKVKEMKRSIYDKIIENKINDKGHNATRRNRKSQGMRIDYFT